MLGTSHIVVLSKTIQEYLVELNLKYHIFPYMKPSVELHIQLSLKLYSPHIALVELHIEYFALLLYDVNKPFVKFRQRKKSARRPSLGIEPRLQEGKPSFLVQSV